MRAVALRLKCSFLSIVIIGCRKYYSPTYSVHHCLFAVFMHLRPTLR